MEALEFLSAVAVFLVSHRVPASRRVRPWLVARLGEKLYLGIYGLISLGAVIWLISAAVRAPAFPLWQQDVWHAVVPLAAMPLAAMLLGAAVLSPNPLSISLWPASPAEPMPAIATVTRHPLLWGFAIWAASHVPPNGELVSVFLFSGLCSFALHGMWLLDRKRLAALGTAEWHRLAEGTSVVPFAAALTGRGRIMLDGRLVAGAAIGLLSYGYFLLDGHGRIIGVEPLWWVSS